MKFEAVLPALSTEGTKIRRETWRKSGRYMRMIQKQLVCNDFGMQFKSISFVDILAEDWEVVA